MPLDTPSADAAATQEASSRLYGADANLFGVDEESIRRARQFKGRGGQGGKGGGGGVSVLIHPMLADWRGERMLELLRPRYVVLYDPDPTIVRHLEVFRARHPGKVRYQHSYHNHHMFCAGVCD